MFISSTVKCIKFIQTCNIANVRHITTESNTASLLSNILGIKDDVAQQFTIQNNINKLEPNRLSDTLNFIKKQKYKVNDVLKNPKLLQLCERRTWEQYHNYFKECGCINVPITNLLNFRKIRYTSVRDLKIKGIIPENAIVVENLLSHLDQPLKEADFQDLNNDDLSLSYIHRAVIHRYLITRLGATEDDLEKINRNHTHIYNKSLKKFCENITIALDIGFTSSKILRNPYILQVKPDNTREVLQKLPNFLNCDMKSSMRSYPKLIGLSVEHFNKIYEILKLNFIPDETIAKTMNIFTLSPYTIDQRLNDIKSIPETNVLMKNPQMLRLIVHYHRAKNRLQFLHKIRLKCASLVIIGFNSTVFDNYLKEGKDVNNRSETNHLIRSLLDCTKDDVNINFKQHPFYLYVPFVDIADTYKYLKRMRFENEHIIKAISILLYPTEKIREVLEKIKSEHYISTRKPRANKSQILNLALYYLEKDHHFTGNGIWKVSDDSASMSH